MVCYNVCPNCGQYMYEQHCRAVCARCGIFFDCEDLFPYDVVVTSSGQRIAISADAGGGSIDYDLRA
jgi:hypothetical protein